MAVCRVYDNANSAGKTRGKKSVCRGYHCYNPASVSAHIGKKSPRQGKRSLWLPLILTPLWVAGGVQARPSAQVQAVTELTSYNVGAEVRVLVRTSNARAAQTDFLATIRYAGETRPVAGPVALSAPPATSGEGANVYQPLWTVPLDARPGRYEIDLIARKAGSGEVILDGANAGAFVVTRKRVRIVRVELDKPFYTSGDAIACQATLENLSHESLSGLRVEFSDRYWPWTAISSGQAAPKASTLGDSVTVPAEGTAMARTHRCGVAAIVDKPALHQYAIVVWDHDRKIIYDIGFSPIILIRPAGVQFPEPYAGPAGFPLQYLHPDLAAIDVSHYRHFYPAAFDSPAIEFNRQHTLFPSGSTSRVDFSVANPTPRPWRGISLRVRWLDPEGKDLRNELVTRGIGLEPGGEIKKTVEFHFDSEAQGVYRVEVSLEGPAGEAIALSSLELAVNPLPSSVLIFCAHPDDEGAHAGIIRAAVENHIPIHLVYFTSGDAGSCDRYYQHSCGPAEALNFGDLRMEEVRAALGHLGVPREDIFFLGLPDGGSGEIWSCSEPTHPYLAVLLATDHAPYAGLARTNLPYARRAVIDEAKEFIKKFQPQMIYSGHPDERHVDHRTNNWFVVKALDELVREGALARTPTLLVDQVYGPGPQRHAPYQYRKHTLSVSGEAMARAQEARWYYQSQDGNRAEGSRRSFDKLRRAEVHFEVLDWEGHEGWNEGH